MTGLLTSFQKFVVFSCSHSYVQCILNYSRHRPHFKYISRDNTSSASTGGTNFPFHLLLNQVSTTQTLLCYYGNLSYIAAMHIY